MGEGGQELEQHHDIGKEKTTKVKSREVSLRQGGQYFNLGEPLKKVTFTRKREEGSEEPRREKDFDVYAEITFQPNDSEKTKAPLHVAIVGQTDDAKADIADKDLFIFSYEEGDDGIREVSDQHALKESTHMNFSDRKHALTITRNGADFAAYTLGHKEGKWGALLPEQRVQTRIKNIKKRIGFEPYSKERDRLKKRIRNTVAATAIMAGAASHGGILDAALNTTQNVVVEVDQMGQKAYGLTPHKLEQLEKQGFGKNFVPDEWKSLARTMQELGDHDYAAIHMQAVEYQKRHAEDFLSVDLLHSSEQGIDEATNAQEVFASLDRVLSFYGKTSGPVTQRYAEEESNMLQMSPYQDKDLGNLKTFTKTLINTIAYLPKPLIRDMDFQRFLFAGTMGNVMNSEGGAYLGQGDIVLSLDNSLWERLYNLIPGIGLSNGQVDLHEMGHAAQAEQSQSLPPTQQPNLLDIPKIVNDQLLQRIWGSQHYPSIYGASGGPNEAAAENERMVLDGDVMGPTEPGVFTSPENKELLDRYALLAARYGPGIIPYLIDHGNSLPPQNDKAYLYMLITLLALKGKIKLKNEELEVKAKKEQES